MSDLRYVDYTKHRTGYMQLLTYLYSSLNMVYPTLNTIYSTENIQYNEKQRLMNANRFVWNSMHYYHCGRSAHECDGLLCFVFNEPIYHFFVKLRSSLFYFISLLIILFMLEWPHTGIHLIVIYIYWRRDKTNRNN